MSTRTKHDIFVEWKATNPKENFRSFWKKQWKREIDFYEELGLTLIPLAIRKKRPMKGYSWDKKPIDYKRAFELVCKDLNLGVILQESKLLAVDWDKPILHDILIDWATRTLTAKTPRGWHLYFKADNSIKHADFDRLRQFFSGNSDMFRYSIQYCLLPLSIVKKENEKPQVYEWINRTEPCAFNKFLREVELAL